MQFKTTTTRNGKGKNLNAVNCILHSQFNILIKSLWIIIKLCLVLDFMLYIGDSDCKYVWYIEAHCPEQQSEKNHCNMSWLVMVLCGLSINYGLDVLFATKPTRCFNSIQFKNKRARERLLKHKFKRVKWAHNYKKKRSRKVI